MKNIYETSMAEQQQNPLIWMQLNRYNNVTSNNSIQ